MTSLTLLGLGPGDPRALTEEARDHLALINAVLVPTLHHPAMQLLPSHLAVTSFDTLYNGDNNWHTLPQEIAAATIAQATAGEAVTYAVPGHPLVGNLAVQHMRALARERGIAVRVIGGASCLETASEALVADLYSGGLQVIDAVALLASVDFPTASAPEQRAWSEMQGIGPYTPPRLPFPLQPAQPALACHADARLIPAIKARLLERYGEDHTVTLVMQAADGTLETSTVLLEQLSEQQGSATLYLSALPVHADVHDIQGLNWVTARLLGPAGCPWDREQTHHSLRRYLLEEAHETLEALDAEDWDALSEELGDLLLQIVLHSEMARQAERFTFGDVTAHITRKLIRRHPHVFGELAVSGSSEVLRNWEAIKAQERAAKGTQRKSLLDGVPASLPALAAAQLLGEKAAKVGFDWPDVDGVWAKVYEELDEIRAALPEQRSEEFGDLLFVLSRLASWLHVDAEAALREANLKFKRRFAACERLAGERTLADLTPEELDVLWNQAKQEQGREAQDEGRDREER